MAATVLVPRVLTDRSAGGTPKKSCRRWVSSRSGIFARASLAAMAVHDRWQLLFLEKAKFCGTLLCAYSNRCQCSAQVARTACSTLNQSAHGKNALAGLRGARLARHARPRLRQVRAMRAGASPSAGVSHAESLTETACSNPHHGLKGLEDFSHAWVSLC
jgi:hypothetical protein